MLALWWLGFAGLARWDCWSLARGARVWWCGGANRICYTSVVFFVFSMPLFYDLIVKRSCLGLLLYRVLGRLEATREVDPPCVG